MITVTQMPNVALKRLGWIHQPNNTDHVDPYKLIRSQMLGCRTQPNLRAGTSGVIDTLICLANES